MVVHSVLRYEDNAFLCPSVIDSPPFPTQVQKACMRSQNLALVAMGQETLYVRFQNFLLTQVLTFPSGIHKSGRPAHSPTPELLAWVRCGLERSPATQAL